MATTNINTTASEGLSPSMQIYYDRKLLINTRPKLVHANDGQKRPVPRNHGKTVKFRKYTPFAPATTPLTEGVTPDGGTLTQTEVEATVQEYGRYVMTSDILELTAADDVINDAVELNADQAGLTLDHVVRDEMASGTNVIYASGSSRSTLTPENKLTTQLIRKAVRALKKAKAKPFFRNGRPYFHAIVGPDTVYDLQDDPKWEAVATYQQAEKVESGEIGRLYGVVFIETTEAKMFPKAGSASADVAATLVYGADSYGVINIESAGAIRTIVKTGKNAGTDDPLEQRSTVAWKVPAFAAKILQPTWIVRIEHGVSA